jgi:hypothetical protein
MSTPTTPTAAAESIGQEIVADAKSFIANTETVLTDDLEAAWAWLKSELAALEPTVLADLKAAVASAATTVASGATTGSVVADTLTQLSNDGAAVLAQVKSSVVQAVVGLATQSPAAP